MAKRRKHQPELPDKSGGQRWEQLRKNWDGVDPAELERRHAMARLLIAGRLPADYLKGESTGSLFDP